MEEKDLIHTIWLFNYHDFSGIYVCTEVDKKGFAYFTAVLTTIGCDPEINILIGDLSKRGTCLWGPRND